MKILCRSFYFYFFERKKERKKERKAKKKPHLRHRPSNDDIDSNVREHCSCAQETQTNKQINKQTNMCDN